MWREKGLILGKNASVNLLHFLLTRIRSCSRETVLEVWAAFTPGTTRTGRPRSQINPPLIRARYFFRQPITTSGSRVAKEQHIATDFQDR